MNEICLINSVRSRMLPYISQIAEASFFSYLIQSMILWYTTNSTPNIIIL